MHYYQFNVADYRKDTTHLTPVEHYIYRWLIDEYHLSEQVFNNNMYKLLRRMGLGENNRADLELILDEFFVPGCDDDYDPVNIVEHPEYSTIGEYPETCQFWIHPRMEQDIETYKNFISDKSAAGKASAVARKAKKEAQTNSSPTGVKQPPTGEQLTTNHKPITKNQEPNPKIKPKGFTIPTGVNPDAWKEFEQHRKDIRKPLTDTARIKAANILLSLSPEQQQACVDKSITSRWAGLFPDKSISKNAENVGDVVDGWLKNKLAITGECKNVG